MLGAGIPWVRGPSKIQGIKICYFFLVALQPNEGYGLLIHDIFLDDTQPRTVVGRNPLDE